jgi:kinesin family protein C2/C3
VSHAGVQPSADTDKEREQATALALDECKQCIQDLEQQLAASQTARQQAEAELGEVQRKLAAVEQDLSATRSAREEARAVLEGKVRLAAGELGGIKEQHSLLQQSAAAMRAEMLQGMQELEDEMLHRTAATVEGIEEERTEALSKLQKEMLERKRLHNLVLDLKGNIRVFCRARPASEASKNALTFASESELLCEAAGKSHSFSYDCVFGPRSQQAEVFAEAHPLVVSVLDGFHACILAYGQTGSGKTHTMQGCPDHPGVNSRALCALFEMADERAATHSYQIKVSLLEIYNETLRDLLQPKDEASGKDKVLDVKLANTAADSAAAGCNTATCVPGVHVAEVGCMQDVLDALKRGEANRTVAGTDMNERSSRSHMVLSVYVEGTNVTSGVKTTGKLHLIDLAGSERLARSNAQGQQLKEAQNINKSLSALGDCIQSLVAKNKHVPFRNSKLTFLLQDSLAGDSKVLMIVCVACEEDNSNETLCSLNFAARARNVVLGPAKSKVSSAADVKLRERERELDNARDSLRRLEASKEELAAKLHDAAGLHDKELAELLAQLKAERCAHLKQKEVLQQLQVKHDEANDKLRSMQDKLRAMERRDDGGEEGEEAGEMGEEETEMAEMTGLEDADVSESKCEQEQKDQQQPSHLPQRSDQAEAAVTETPRWATPTLSSLAGDGDGACMHAVMR